MKMRGSLRKSQRSNTIDGVTVFIASFSAANSFFRPYREKAFELPPSSIVRGEDVNLVYNHSNSCTSHALPPTGYGIKSLLCEILRPILRYRAIQATIAIRGDIGNKVLEGLEG